MTPLEASEPTYGEGYEVGYATGRGEIIRGLDLRAAAEERNAMTATTVVRRQRCVDVAAWLRELAAEARRGEL